MKFMITWRIHDEKRHEALDHFSGMSAEDDAADLGGVKLIGRWHDLVSFTGMAICEADDVAAVSNWILNWNAIIDAEVTPVCDDDEARAIGRART